MADLTFEELRDVVHKMLVAELVGDAHGIMSAMDPVDGMADVFRITTALVQIVADTMSTVCPVHGGDCPDSAPLLTFGVVPVDEDGQPDLSSLENGELPSIPPELEVQEPGLVAWMRMIIAILADDEDQLAAVFCAAVNNGTAADLTNRALQQAGLVVRAQKWELQ